MFAEWFVAGAEIGFKAFFAVAVFAMCTVFVLGLLATIVGLFVGEVKDDET